MLPRVSLSHPFAIHFSNEVSKAVNKKIAELASWSISIASMGLAPWVGFENEEFSKDTYRHELRGKELALGWKPPD